MFGNVTAMVLTLVNWILRWNNVEEAILPLGLILSTIVASLLAITGWFGAELIYRHKIAVIGTGDSPTERLTGTTRTITDCQSHECDNLEREQTFWDRYQIDKLHTGAPPSIREICCGSSANSGWYRSISKH